MPRMSGDSSDEPVQIPITGELDLHTFRPDEAGDLLDHYLAECQRRDLLRVRVIHGKGTGTLRALVQARLRRSPLVAGFAQGDEHSGGWGATIVTLKSRNS
jgi:DNA-nicking Smr family endonuclease